MVLPAEPRRLRILFLELAMVQAARLLCGLGLPGLFTPAWFRAAVSLSLGALVLLDAGLYSPASSRQPSGGSIGAIIGPCIEGNRRAWGSLMNSVDDGFE